MEEKESHLVENYTNKDANLFTFSTYSVTVCFIRENAAFGSLTLLLFILPFMQVYIYRVMIFKFSYAYKFGSVVMEWALK